MGWVSTQPPPYVPFPRPRFKLVKTFRLPLFRMAKIYFDMRSRAFFVLAENWLDAGSTRRDLTDAEKAKHLTPEIIAECLAAAMGG